ncbi:MAG: Fe-only nitrogenase accessory AnfO family protein [Bacillota bacterium]
MPAEIAVHVGESGETASLQQKGKIRVYRKCRGKWDVSREKDFYMEKDLGIKDLRGKVGEIPEFLSECKVLVALNVVGIPYFELEKYGVSIWEFEGSPHQFLDYILEKEEEDRQSRERTNVNPFPVEISSGCYSVSIKEIQEKNTGFTSKQALLPFLRKGGFFSLEVICNHIPPWLETELVSRMFSWEVRTSGLNEITLTITRRCCG